jgi:uncharacterized protein (DUF1800 family)
MRQLRANHRTFAITAKGSGRSRFARSISVFAALVLLCNTASAQQATADDIRTATHFLENATFGPTGSEIANVLARGRDGWLAYQFSRPESPMPDGLDANQVRAQLYLNMSNGSDQLRQRMMFALSQYIVVSANKVGTGPELIPWVRMLSRNAFGNYRTLLTDVTLSPTMGKFLDLAYSRKASATSSPNENYARELLQLFTIGLWELNQDGSLKVDASGQPIPTYDQRTIAEFSRALTGWTFPVQPGSTSSNSNPPYFVGQMEARVTTHDTGAKTLLRGVVLPAGQTTTADLHAALDNIFQHPNVPPFVATRLIRSLVTSNPSAGYIERVANVFANNGDGVRGDLRAVLTAILTDAEALRFSGSDAGRLKDPLLHVIGLGRALGARVTDPNAFMYLFNNLTQRVLTPATVFGFYSPLAALPGSSGLYGPEFQIYPPALAIQRANFIYSILNGNLGAAYAIDLTPYINVAAVPASLVDAVDHHLMFGRMSAQLRQILLTTTAAISASNTRQRALGALYLAAISSEYAVSADNDGAGIATLVLPPPTPENPGGCGGGGGGGGSSSSGGGGGTTSSGGGTAPAPEMPAPSTAVSSTTPIELTGSAAGFTLNLAWRNPVGSGAPTSLLLDVAGSINTTIPLGVAESFHYSGVPQGTYTFSVRAVSAQGVSAPSNSVTLAFPGHASGAAASCVSAPTTPTNLTARRDGNTVIVQWRPPASGVAASYVLNVTGSYVGSFSTVALGLSGSVAPGAYTVSVQALNACGASNSTPAITVTVP